MKIIGKWETSWSEAGIFDECFDVENVDTRFKGEREMCTQVWSIGLVSGKD